MLFGGIGIVAYLALIAFVPADDGEPAWIEGRSRVDDDRADRACWRIAAVSMLSPPDVPARPRAARRRGGCSALGVGLYRAFGGARGDDPARIVARATLVAARAGR